MCDALIGHDKCAETCTAFSRSPCCLGRYSSCKKAEHVRLCNKARSISFELGFWFQAYLSWNEHEDPNMKILKSISDPLVLVFLGSLRNRGLSMILKRDTCWWNTCCFDKANIETSIRAEARLGLQTTWRWHHGYLWTSQSRRLRVTDPCRKVGSNGTLSGHSCFHDKTSRDGSVRYVTSRVMCEGNLDVTFRIISLCFTMLSWYMSQRCLEEKARRMAVCIVLARPKQYSKIWRKAISILNTVVSVLSCNCSPKILSPDKTFKTFSFFEYEGRTSHRFSFL